MHHGIGKTEQSRRKTYTEAHLKSDEKQNKPFEPIPPLDSNYFDIIYVMTVENHTEIKMYPEFIRILQVKPYLALDSD